MNQSEQLAKHIEEAIKNFTGEDAKIHTIDLSSLNGKTHGVDDIEKMLKDILGGKCPSQENGLPEELARLLKHTGISLDEVKKHADADISFIDDIMEASKKHSKDPVELLESMAGYMYSIYCSERKFDIRQGTEFLYKSKVLSSKLVSLLNKETSIHNGDEMIITLLGAIKEIADISKKNEHKCNHASADKIKNRDKADKINDLLQQLSKTLAS